MVFRGTAGALLYTIIVVPALHLLRFLPTIVGSAIGILNKPVRRNDSIRLTLLFSFYWILLLGFLYLYLGGFAFIALA